MTPPYLDIHPDVVQAMAQQRPVVALESTIISHGMSYPQNVATALQVEAEVRAHGAVPATITILNGRLKAGLTATEIETPGQSGRSGGTSPARGAAAAHHRQGVHAVSAGAGL